MRDLKTEFGIQFGYLRGRGNHPEATIADAEAKLKTVVDLQGQYNARVDTLTRSGDLTSLGLKKALAALGLEFRGKLKFLQDTLTGLNGNIRQTAQSLQPPAVSAGDSIVDYLRGMEIRQSLKTRDPLELAVLYRQETPGSPVARALESSPIPLLKPELVAEVHLIWGREAHPEEAARLDSLRELQSLYQYALKLATDEFAVPIVEAATVAQV
jgi:hypothetical protein